MEQKIDTKKILVIPAWKWLLNEIQLKQRGGWSDKLAGTFIDARNRKKVIAADTAEEAVKIAIEEAKRTLLNPENIFKMKEEEQK